MMEYRFERSAVRQSVRSCPENLRTAELSNCRTQP
jgi:hypothetical protein